MQNSFIRPVLFRAGKILLSLLFLLATVSQPVMASATSSAKTNSTWKITVSGKTNLVCLGDKVLFIARWQPNPDYVEPLAPLSGSGNADDNLAPLTGPRKIMANANLGSFDPEVETPGLPMGIAPFTYKAEKTGTETIELKVFNDNLDVDASITKTFEVKNCSYMYSLIVKDDLSQTTDRGLFSFYHILSSKGTLKSIPSVTPNIYEGFDKYIKDVFTLSSVNDCQIVNDQYGMTLGFVDAKAVKDDEGGITLMIGPPKDYQGNVTISVICDGEPIQVNKTFNVSGGKDPWIEKYFPLGEGEVTIDSKELNPGIPQLEAAGFQVTTSARLKLEKVAK